MTFPLVTETALPQEPVAHDTFIDDLAAPVTALPSAHGLVGGGLEPPPAQRPA
jgi:hypothetical protein